MLISLTITIGAALVLFALLGGGLFLARRLATEGAPAVSLRGWRWYPSPLGMLIVAVVVALLAFRFFPVFIFIPFILPFVFRRGRRGFGNVFRFPGGRDDDDDERRPNGNGGPRRPPWS